MAEVQMWPLWRCVAKGSNTLRKHTRSASIILLLLYLYASALSLRLIFTNICSLATVQRRT
jgi:hypothetical protein